MQMSFDQTCVHSFTLCCVAVDGIDKSGNQLSERTHIHFSQTMTLEELLREQDKLKMIDPRTDAL